MGFSRAPSSVGRSPGKKEIAVSSANALTTRTDRPLGKLVGMARANGIFAVSEICKGLAILTIGDMVIADGVGEFVCIAALTIEAPPFLGWRASEYANSTVLPSL
ncbi:hypothetical protein HUN39_18150 [Methylocystis sp. FS]|uniref:hypothetical protein n=1 Tax=Methylocystis silviterrae TaxID=2743612 RepID=UPI0015839A93|nr:hypothetical protein [Methylocystis silviterrae]NUJ81909.1 hypothetical protein [Methylocystis silviterrae]